MHLSSQSPAASTGCKGGSCGVTAQWSLVGQQPVILIGDTKRVKPDQPAHVRLLDDRRIVAQEDTWLDLLHMVVADDIRFGDMDEQLVELEAEARDDGDFLLIISIGDGDYLWFGLDSDGALVEHVFDAEELDSFFDDARLGKYDSPGLTSLRAGKA